MRTRDTDSRQTDADRAWQLYCERGVVLSSYADEIAERKRILREWAAAGRGLR